MHTVNGKSHRVVQGGDQVPTIPRGQNRTDLNISRSALRDLSAEYAICFLGLP